MLPFVLALGTYGCMGSVIMTLLLALVPVLVDFQLQCELGCASSEPVWQLVDGVIRKLLTWFLFLFYLFLLVHKCLVVVDSDNW
uniref:Uncharacterized protein n=1 Tax=Manihot esculenta TaxID=3983 RepID=A0A2C9VYA8_MANES